MTQEIEAWRSEYELRTFISMATHSPIDKVYIYQTKESPFTIYTENIKNARENFELFSNQVQELETEPTK